MLTTVMFIHEATPLASTPTRLLTSPEDVMITDAEGKIEVDLPDGTHTFEVQLHNKWVSRTISRAGDQPIFIVDVSRKSAEKMTGMNTLQMNLAELVGDRYVFETILGRGGMGIVVKAIDRMLNRPVAIKMLSDELRDNEEAQQIFLIEARNLATLNHPNLVAIHDILNVDGNVLMVFEYVLGENIEKAVQRDGPLQQTETLKLAIQLMRCVSYLHTHDLIHRDLKPANLIKQPDGTLKLVDFGLARSLNDLYIRGTRVRGTPAYMAPEQVQGIHLTVATDIYQIGITLFEMLTGELPFTGDMSYAHVHEKPPLVTDVVPEIDAGFASLIDNCLAKKPSNRPANVEEVLHSLQTIYSRVSTDHDAQFSSSAMLSSASMQHLSQRSDMLVDPSLMGAERRVVSGPNGMLIAAAVVAAIIVLGGIAYVFFGSDSAPVVSPLEATPVAAKTSKSKVAVVGTEPDGESFTMAAGITELGYIAAKNEADTSAESLAAQNALPEVLVDDSVTPSQPTMAKRRTVRRVAAKKVVTKEKVVTPKKKSKSKKKSAAPPKKSGSDLLATDGGTNSPKTKKKKSGSGLLPMNE